MIQTKALEVSTELGNENLKASNGWLEKFRRHNLSYKIVSDQESAVDTKVVEEWERMLPSLTSSYAPKDISNVDEISLFFEHYQKNNVFKR